MTATKHTSSNAGTRLAPRSAGLDRHLTQEGRNLTEAVSALTGLIRERAEEAESNGRLSDEVVQGLAATGLYRAVAPLEYGGLALGARDVFELARTLGAADGAAGWTFLVAGSLRMVSAFPEALVADLYRDAESWAGPVAAGGSTFAAVTGQARRVDGGWMVKGKWSFASGNHHAKWIFGGVRYTDDSGASGSQPEGHGLVMMDPAFLQRRDDWHVSGMAASDSNTLVAAEEFFVPEHRFVDMAQLPVLMDSVSQRFGGLAYAAQTRGSMMTVMVLNIGILVGMAEGCFEAFNAQVNARKPFSPPYPSVAHMASTQVAAGKANAMIAAAAAVVLGYADAIDQHATEGTDFDAAQEAAASAQMAWAGQQCSEAMDLMLRIVGSSAISTSNPIQRYGRDARVILSHGALRLEPLAEIAGRHLLGLPPFDMFAAGLQNKAPAKDAK